jgi:hypothetical protein
MHCPCRPGGAAILNLGKVLAVITSGETKAMTSAAADLMFLPISGFVKYSMTRNLPGKYINK